ncbi:efflux RND transporter periplasmic adaptor subunit [Flavobacterium plurextorum]|uniref:Efflux transporter periplasmic adaptor subunit n=1 Tax=Flavobacterium plurextorum TaxID=1114867 RepID=A0ABX4CVR1_9FLAO|nr:MULTISPECIES: efflux RND transporter periplasmic adaptor subunit [Flavobacterium]OXB08143.1 efflux transporter periplasmic adaptor subunit [Flavobacterium plurextorum]PIF69865.1 membrane fusion protein (multidrug efflux system) [Flavobacterium sp. 2]UUW10015.1 efflux RND transporter periplasmic adaptor subunit [Flavobacterium plurextorum]
MNKIYLSAILILFFLSACKKETPPAPKPLEISILTVLNQDVKVESEYTGQTYGQSDIQINPRVDGVIISMNFKEGGFVTKGQLLYTIDPLPYKAKVNESEGALAESQARLAKTKADLDMIAPLAKINAVSQRELISAKSAYNASQAQIKASQASLENSKIELGYCQILAPISGLIGISKVRVGDYVRPGAASVLNTISDLGDVRVRFTMSEQEFLRLFREFNKPDSPLKGTGAVVSLKLSDGSTYPESGRVSFADRQIDPSTGAITFEASFANPDKLLRPGQYVKVGLLTDVRKNAIVIPQRAVIEVQGIYQVYVLGKDNKVNMQIVKPGPSVKDGYVIEDGLKPGDKIAMGGTSLLKNGSVITPKIVQWELGQTEAGAAK